MHQSTLDDMRAFIDEHVVPLEPLLLTQQFDALFAAVEDVRNLVRAKGWWAPNLPKEAGGPGFDLVELGRISEVVGRSPVGHLAFGCQAPDAGNAELLLKYASDRDRERFLQPLAQGKIRSCFCMTEPEHAGSDPIVMSTNATIDGDHWVLTGHKWFATAADGASFAIVMAVTDPDGAPHERASMFLVPTDLPGFEIVRNISIMGHEGQGFYSHSEVRFHDVRIPKDALLGPRAKGFLLAQQRLGPGRIHHCMRWLGIADRALDLMCERAMNREIRGKTLADQQIIQTWIAEGKAEWHAARALVLETAAAIEQEGFKQARMRVSMIKFLVAGVLGRILDRALQTHGALGMTDDTILAFYYREERASRIYDGPDEVHKLSVARQILKAKGHRKRT